VGVKFLGEETFEEGSTFVGRRKTASGRGPTKIRSSSEKEKKKKVTAG